MYEKKASCVVIYVLTISQLTIAEELGFEKLKTVTPDFPQMFLPEFTILNKKVKRPNIFPPGYAGNYN